MSHFFGPARRSGVRSMSDLPSLVIGPDLQSALVAMVRKRVPEPSIALLRPPQSSRAPLLLRRALRRRRRRRSRRACPLLRPWQAAISRRSVSCSTSRAPPSRGGAPRTRSRPPPSTPESGGAGTSVKSGRWSSSRRSPPLAGAKTRRPRPLNSERCIRRACSCPPWTRRWTARHKKTPPFHMAA